MSASAGARALTGWSGPRLPAEPPGHGSCQIGLAIPAKLMLSDAATRVYLNGREAASQADDEGSIPFTRSKFQPPEIHNY